jgi:hypothetical protein
MNRCRGRKLDVKRGVGRRFRCSPAPDDMVARAKWSRLMKQHRYTRTVPARR